MTEIEILNNELEVGVEYDFERSKEKIFHIEPKYPLIAASLELCKKFDVDSVRNRLMIRLKDILIPEWKEYNKRDNFIKYDAIYFEFGDDSGTPYEAFSYGIHNMKNYELTSSSLDIGYDYEFGIWEAGIGMVLEAFDILQPFNYTEELELEIDKVRSDRNSGYNEIEIFCHSATRFILNSVFSEADSNGLFSEIGIKSGGLFIYDVHDGGTGKTPFHLKQ